MKSVTAKIGILVVAFLLQTAADAVAQGSLKLPVAGSSVRGAGSFSGTVAVSRFETRGNEIVAIGFVSGTVNRRNRALGTVLVGEVVIPVTMRAGGVSTVNGRSTVQPRLRRVSITDGGTAPSARLVQAADCNVIDVVLGPFNINVEGVPLAIEPIEVHLEAQPGTPLGELICQANALITNVGELVGVVNNILDLLILLLGGGLGGVIPPPPA